MNEELMLVLLFVIATAVAIVARRLRVPYTVALVVAGLVLGSLKLTEAPHLTHALLFAVILPGLLFEAAFHLQFRRFWADRVAINALAVPGLLVSVGLTAVLLTPLINVLHVDEGFTLSHALLFGAVISATDPIAVVGLFKVLGAPRRLVTLVEGESLVNDGTGIVLFGIALAAAAGEPVTLSSGLLDFVRIAGLGILVGGAVGWVVSRVVLHLDEAMLELTLTMIAAYGSFALAERLHVSGVMATVTAGMVCGSYAARVGMSATTRLAVETFWEYVSFALNSMVFLLIGLEIDLPSLLASWQPILVAFVATMAGRFFVVFAVTGLLKRTRAPISWKQSVVLGWAGLRGALSMVLVLSLPEHFAHRALLVNMTFGVVLMSILVQGLSMGRLLKALGLLVESSPAQQAWTLARATATGIRAALSELEKIHASGAIPVVTYEALRAELRDRQRGVEAGLAQLKDQGGALYQEELRDWRRRLLQAERQGIVELQREGELSSAATSKLVSAIDEQLRGTDQPEPSAG